MCQKKQSRAPVPLLHPPYVSTPRQIPSHVYTTMLKVLLYVGEATPRKEAAPEIPTNRRPGERGLFKGFPAEKVQVAAVHWPGWAVGGPGWVWRCWSSQGTRRSVCRGAYVLAPTPRCLCFSLSSLGIRAVQAPEMCHQAGCPRPEGNNVGILFFLLNLFFLFYGNTDDFPCVPFQYRPTLFLFMYACIHCFSDSFPIHVVTVCCV